MPSTSPPAEPHLFFGANRVLFLGDSITWDGRYPAYIETYFVTRYPGRQPEFINAGVPSETVSGLSEPGHADGQFLRPALNERLARVLDKTRPDLIFACYGMNDGIYLPFDAGRFAAFCSGLTELHSAALAAGARIIHITPPVFDGERGQNPAYADTLARYSARLLEQRDQGWEVMDVHGPMSDYLMEKRRAEPAFHFAEDGIHPDDFGHWFIAREILSALGATDVQRQAGASEMASAHPEGAQILALVRERAASLRDAWLTTTGHNRPGLPQGLPLSEAQQKAFAMRLRIQGLLAPGHTPTPSDIGVPAGEP